MRSIIMATLSRSALALLTLAACSSAPPAEPEVATAARPASSDAPSARARTEREVQIEKGIRWARCMTEHGVDTPDGGAGGPAVWQRSQVSQDVQNEAWAACRKHYPEKTWRKLDPEEAQRQRAYAACMSGEGVTVPVPDANDELAEEVRWDSPGREFMRAHVACRSHLTTADSAGDPPPLDDPGRGE